jgi:two-component system NtrC family response regulator
MTGGRILIVEDDDALREAMHAQFVRDGYQATSACDVAQALSILEKDLQDLIIADLNLPGSSGIDLLKKVRVDYPDTVVIIITGYGTVETAVEAMKSGAYDFIVKPVHPAELKILVSRALEHSRLKEEVQTLRSSFDRKYGFEQIIGSSESLLRALDVAGRVAGTDATVLIRGETGTGKEMVAKAIHLRSPRRERPFVTVNCAAIPKELLESELFGHLKGSFTGAFSHKKGKIEMAEGGTVMLDEIGDMPLELQVRILRLIQEHEIEKVGATAPITVNVRIIAATHRDLQAMVRQDSFREDLYYRLMVIPVDLPPLRGRFGDIPELVQYFLQKYKVKHGRAELKMPQNLMPFFLQYAWPGNVRELENAVARMVILSNGPKLTPEDLPEFLRGQPSRLQVEAPAGPMSLADVEKQLVLDALQRFNGNQTRAARYLKMSRRTFSYRLQRYGIEPAAVKSMKQSA